MFFNSQVGQERYERYGRPREAKFTFEMRPDEFTAVTGSMKKGWAHDITLFIFRGRNLVVIHKNTHPPLVYRAPSGGLHPGESLEEGARREAKEETGLDIELERYLLRAQVTFTCKGQAVEWWSHVFSAPTLAGELVALDKKEIGDVRLASLEEVKTGLQDLMRQAGSGGLAYRAALTEAVLPFFVN